MGYRSEVAYLIIFGDGRDKDRERNEEDTKAQEKALAKFYQFLTEAKVNEKTMGVFNEEVDVKSKEGLYIDREAGYIKFEAEHVKWYEDFDDVKCHNNLLRLVDEYIEGVIEDEISIGYSFVRIGEEYSDIQTESNGHWGASELLYPTRGICIEI